jgi:hypothetical protein
MAVLKNDELEIMQKINNILNLTTYECAVFYESLTEEQKTDIVKFARLIGKLENDRDMQRIRTKLANREKRKINKEYGRRKQA